MTWRQSRLSRKRRLLFKSVTRFLRNFDSSLNWHWNDVFLTYFLRIILKENEWFNLSPDSGLFFSTVSWNSDVSIKHLPINYSWSSKTPLPPAREVRPCRLKCSVSLVYFVRMLNGQPRKKPVRTPLLPIRNREHEGRNIPDEDECSVALTKSYTDLFSLWLTRIKWQVKRTQSLSPASAYSVTPFQSLFTCITQV